MKGQLIGIYYPMNTANITRELKLGIKPSVLATANIFVGTKKQDWSFIKPDYRKVSRPKVTARDTAGHFKKWS